MELSAARGGKKKFIKHFVKVLVAGVLAAGIILTYFFAIIASENMSQIYLASFDGVEYELQNGEPVIKMYDGRFIARQGEGYVLYKEDRRLSNSYKSLRLASYEKGIYEFVSFDKEMGRLGSNGKEIISFDGEGVFINDIGLSENCFFYVEEEGKFYAKLFADGAEYKSRGYASIFTHRYLRSNLLPLSLPENLADGVFAAHDNNNQKVLANVFNENAVPLNDITAVYPHHVIANGAVYSLPYLEAAEALDAGAKAFESDGVLAIADGGKIKIVGGQMLEFSGIPTRMIKASSDRLLFELGGNNALLISGTQKYEGTYDILGAAGFVAYRVGDSLFNAALEKLGVTGSHMSVSYYKGKAFINVNNSLYSYDNFKIEKLIEGVSSTFGNSAFLSNEHYTADGSLLREYDVWFWGNDKIYNTDLAVKSEIKGALPIGKGLVLANNIYYNFAGKKSIEAVSEYFIVKNYDGQQTAEYVFKKSDGYYTFEGKAFDLADGGRPEFIKTEAGGLIMLTSLGVGANGKFYSFSEYENINICGGGLIYFVDNNVLTTLEVTSKKTVISTVGNIEKNSVSKLGNGVLYADNNGLKGLVGSDGKTLLAPLYDEIEQCGSGYKVKQGQFYAYFSPLSNNFTRFDYTQIEADFADGQYVIATDKNGKQIMLNSYGNRAAKSIKTDGEYAVINAVNYKSYYGQYVIDKEVGYSFVMRNDNNYMLIKSVSK